MSDLESSKTPVADTSELRQLCASLQRQVTTLLVAVFVLSGTLTVFLWRQARYARADLEVLKPPAAHLIQSFKQEKLLMDDFVAKLAEFGKKHPDFAPILAKYKIQPAAAQPAAVPGLTSAPPAIAVPPLATNSTTPKK
jgi:hypothetical protein